MERKIKCFTFICDTSPMSLNSPLSTNYQLTLCFFLKKCNSIYMVFFFKNYISHILIHIITYNAIMTKQWTAITGGWRKMMWNWEFPLKLKLFFWLVAEYRVLTWENLQIRGHVGPGICQLCKNSGESVNHCFVHCSFTSRVWDNLNMMYPYTIGWRGSTILDCMNCWYAQNRSAPTLPVYICWYIWLERNLVIF
jgi:hypothetical protein